MLTTLLTVLLSYASVLNYMHKENTSMLYNGQNVGIAGTHGLAYNALLYLSNNIYLQSKWWNEEESTGRSNNIYII